MVDPAVLLLIILEAAFQAIVDIRMIYCRIQIQMRNVLS
jgi:hypothetical protein